MTSRYLFADEAGCFSFTREPNVSKYFIICTVTMSELAVAGGLNELRRKLLWDRVKVGDYFHATVDSPVVREKVFQEILKYDFKVQAIICEKSKAQPKIRQEKARFYKYPWYYLLKFGIAKHITDSDELLVTAASIGTKKEKATFCDAISDVLYQNLWGKKWMVDFRPSSCDPCLQLADYCCWAIQRKWERKDQRFYDLIASRITYEYDLWAHGDIHYY